MDLKEHLKAYTRSERAELASRSGTTLGHLTNVANGFRRCSPGLAVALERATNGALRRQTLLPDEWRDIWPELVHQDNSALLAQRTMPPGAEVAHG